MTIKVVDPNLTAVHLMKVLDVEHKGAEAMSISWRKNRRIQVVVEYERPINQDHDGINSYSMIEKEESGSH